MLPPILPRPIIASCMSMFRVGLVVFVDRTQRDPSMKRSIMWRSNSGNADLNGSERKLPDTAPTGGCFLRFDVLAEPTIENVMVWW
jgi:hypothetical protein